MLRFFLLGSLAGCQVAFPLRDTFEGEEVCAGNEGSALFAECVRSRHPAISRPASIVTGDLEDPSSLAECDLVMEQTDVDGTELCVIAANDIELGATVVTGTRPLVLMAVNELRIKGIVSVTSRGAQNGAGAEFQDCASGAGENGPGAGGAGGGAGGSFATLGGDGGRGSLDLSGGGGGTASPISPLTFLRGGCRGGDGGTGLMLPAKGGAGGRSGGAIYLVAGSRIILEGAVDASGEGGKGGTAASGTGGAGGGGGGGSGGMIALDAPSIVLESGSRLVANGGGGGAGGNDGGSGGMPGSNADPDSAFPFEAPGGGGIGGGDGGTGADAIAEMIQVHGRPVLDGGAGAGGGGGGLGFIFAFGEIDLRGTFASSPSLE